MVAEELRGWLFDKKGPALATGRSKIKRAELRPYLSPYLRDLYGVPASLSPHWISVILKSKRMLAEEGWSVSGSMQRSCAKSFRQRKARHPARSFWSNQNAGVCHFSMSRSVIVTPRNVPACLPSILSLSLVDRVTWCLALV